MWVDVTVRLSEVTEVRNITNNMDVNCMWVDVTVTLSGLSFPTTGSKYINFNTPLLQHQT